MLVQSQQHDALNVRPWADLTYFFDASRNITGYLELWDDGHYTGNGSNVTLTGGTGRDTLRGIHGNNTINGGLGLDNLIGGDGADTFIFKSGYGAGSGTAAGTMNITGGTGTETLSIQGGGNVSIKGVKITNVGSFVIDDSTATGATTLILDNNAQANLITSDNGATFGFQDHVVLNKGWVVDPNVLNHLFGVGVSNVDWQDKYGYNYSATNGATSGTFQVVESDNLNNKSWSTITTQYTDAAPTTPIEQLVVYNDTTTRDTHYANGVPTLSTELDPNNTYSWSRIVTAYNAAGQVIQADTTFNVGPYASERQIFNAGLSDTNTYNYLDGHQGIIGGTSANVHLLVEGTAFNDTLKGGTGGANIFEFTGGGRDTVINFHQGTDLLDLSAFGVTSFTTLPAGDLAVQGSNTIITLAPGHQIVLQGFTGTLQNSDFTNHSVI